VTISNNGHAGPPTPVGASAAEEAWESFGRWVVALLIAGFEGGFLIMLMLGVVAGQTGDARWAVGYWTCVPVGVGLRLLFIALTTSTRKYARPPLPVARR
jgi:hypothetical protein